jgi:chromosome segregation ATPase
MRQATKISPLRLSSLLLGLALLSLPLSHAVAAEKTDKKDKQERAAQFRLQQLQQKFEQEKAALEQENAALKEQLKKGEAVLAVTKKSDLSQRSKVSGMQAEIAEKDTQLASCRRDAESAKLAAQKELSAKQQSLQQSEALNKQLNGEKSRLETALAEQKSEVASCQVKNTNLLNQNKEMANKYEKTALKEVEPLTGLKGVAIENGFQDARDKAEAEVYKPRKKQGN